MNQENDPNKEPASPPLAGTPPPRPIPPSRPVRPKKAFDPTGRGALELLLKSPAHAVEALCNSASGLSTGGKLAGISLISMAAFGLIMGLFGGYDDLWISPVKVVGGLLFALLLCFPSFYIFLSLSGADLRWKQVLGLITGFVSLAALVLIGLLPVAWVFTVSTESGAFMGGLYIGFWIAAAWFGLGFLSKALESIDQLPLGFMKLWWFIFMLVTLQMTTTLRPLLGRSEQFLQTEKMFFLDHWMQTVENVAAPPTKKIKR